MKWILTLLAITLAACGGQQTTEQSQAEPQAPEVQTAPQSEQPKQLAPTPEEEKEEARRKQLKAFSEAFADFTLTEETDTGTRQKSLNELVCGMYAKWHQMHSALAFSAPANEKEWSAVGMTQEEAQKQLNGTVLLFVQRLGDLLLLGAEKREAMARTWNSCDGQVELRADSLVDAMTDALDNVDAAQQVSAGIRDAALANFRERLELVRKQLEAGSADERGNAQGEFEELAGTMLGVWGFSSTQFLSPKEVDELLKRYLPATRSSRGGG